MQTQSTSLLGRLTLGVLFILCASLAHAIEPIPDFYEEGGVSPKLNGPGSH